MPIPVFPASQRNLFCLTIIIFLISIKFNQLSIIYFPFLLFCFLWCWLVGWLVLFCFLIISLNKIVCSTLTLKEPYIRDWEKNKLFISNPKHTQGVAKAGKPRVLNKKKSKFFWIISYGLSLCVLNYKDNPMLFSHVTQSHVLQELFLQFCYQ